jgi:hypothetical protein
MAGANSGRRPEALVQLLPLAPHAGSREAAMPDIPIESGGPSHYPADVVTRVAVLEQAARSTTATLERIERRHDSQFAEVRSRVAEQRAGFRWLVGGMPAGFGTRLGAFGAVHGATAHGFHWL